MKIINNPESTKLAEEIIAGIRAGERVKVTHLGVFEAKERQARQGRNPRTGEVIQIPAKRKVVFRAAKDLKESVL